MNPTVSDQSWNDPPVVKFEITATAKKHHLLNKRVIENESKLQTSSSSNKMELSGAKFENLTLEDVSPEMLKNSETSGSIIKSSETILPLSDEEKLSSVISILLKVLGDTEDKCEKTTKDINKRIDIMKSSWSSNLSAEVKNKMFQLALELEKGNIDAALKIQWSLSIENVREVKSWMVGVKHIIEMKKERIVPNELQNIDFSPCL